MIFTKNFYAFAEAYKISLNGPNTNQGQVGVIKAIPAGETPSTWYTAFTAWAFSQVYKAFFTGGPTGGNSDNNAYIFNKKFVNKTTGETAMSGGNDSYAQLVLSYEEGASENANDLYIDYDTILSVSGTLSQTRYRGIINGKTRYVWKGVITNTGSSALTFNQIGAYSKLDAATDQYGSAISTYNSIWLMMWKHVFSTAITVQPTESVTIAIVFDIDIGDESAYATDITPISF